MRLRHIFLEQLCDVALRPARRRQFLFKKGVFLKKVNTKFQKKKYNARGPSLYASARCEIVASLSELRSPCGGASRKNTLIKFATTFTSTLSAHGSPEVVGENNPFLKSQKGESSLTLRKTQDARLLLGPWLMALLQSAQSSLSGASRKMPSTLGPVPKKRGRVPGARASLEYSL